MATLSPHALDTPYIKAGVDCIVGYPKYKLMPYIYLNPHPTGVDSTCIHELTGAGAYFVLRPTRESTAMISPGSINGPAV